MDNLEHRIKKAFIAQDESSEFSEKEDLWQRLDSEMRPRKGVAGFWRVAAVLLGVVLFSGTFAALQYRSKQQMQIDKLAFENEKLVSTIDSLWAVKTAQKTEIQIVEREKIVYREKMVERSKSSSDENWRERYQKLSDSTQMILANKTKTYNQEITHLQNELLAAKNELVELEKSTQNESANKAAVPFQLKSERVDVGKIASPSVKSPEMEMKIFQKQFIENRNNLNSTIFKK
ncbi:hypothetical protein [uncultured Draconibacterium sp.]|uniref:hypothetical protein n=1 Tax=uncultured Draconibacterium sp. TaxID=1573823 RepID=UPI0032174993